MGSPFVPLSAPVFLPAVAVCIAVGYLSGRARAIALAALLPVGILLLWLPDGSERSMELVLSLAVWGGAVGAASIATGIALGQVDSVRGHAREVAVAAAYVAVWTLLARSSGVAFVIAFLVGVPLGYAIGRWWAIGLACVPLLTIVPTDSPALGLVGVPYAVMTAGLIAAGVAYRRSSAPPAEPVGRPPRRRASVGTGFPLELLFGGLMAVVAVVTVALSLMAVDPGCTEGPCGDDFLIVIGIRVEAAIALMWVVTAIAASLRGQDGRPNGGNA